MIKGIGFDHTRFNFPCGETNVQITDYRAGSRVSIHFKWESNEDIIELLLVADALKRLGITIEGIALSYIPYSRQDRVCNEGEALSIKVFADLINSIGAKEVTVLDPHSDVSTALINNCKVYDQTWIFSRYLRDLSGFYLVSPDSGALKKIYKLASVVNPKGIIACSKVRNIKTGDIEEIYMPGLPEENKPCYIVDDICDGGKTFVEIAKKLKMYSPRKIVLMVTHGFFTKGLDVFDGLIDEIFTKEGRIK